MTPNHDYTGGRTKSITDFRSPAGALLAGYETIVRGGGWRISLVASVAIRKNKRAFAGMCRLKSTRLCVRNPRQAMNPESWSVEAKALVGWERRRREWKRSTPRNQTQHKPPAMPVSARPSR